MVVPDEKSWDHQHQYHLSPGDHEYVYKISWQCIQMLPSLELCPKCDRKEKLYFSLAVIQWVSSLVYALSRRCPQTAQNNNISAGTSRMFQILSRCIWHSLWKHWFCTRQVFYHVSTCVRSQKTEYVTWCWIKGKKGRK